MKKLYVLFFISIFVQVVLAQPGSDSLVKICNYDDFPVGAIRPANADTLENMLGMNCNWYGFPIGSSSEVFPIQRRPYNNLSHLFHNPFYYDTTDYEEKDGNWILNTAAYGIDCRVYLPNTSPTIKEYNYGWNNKIGFNQTGPTVIRPNEWFIPGDTAPKYSYVLSDIGAAKFDPYLGNGRHQVELSGNYNLYPYNINTYSYELVLSFNPLDLGSVGNTDSLYMIEYWIKKKSDADYVKVDSVLITKTFYNSLLPAITQVSGRKVGAEKLDAWAGTPNGVQYRLQKKILNIRAYYENSFQDAPQVDVRLKTFHKIPIYVRCLRIRDWVAQRLLTGAADDSLKKIINYMYNYSDNKNIKSWTIGNEPTYKNAHTYTYLNERLVNNNVPPLNVLIPFDFNLYLRIGTDQSENVKGKPKAIYWHEMANHQGAEWRVWEKNLDGSVKIKWSYKDRGFSLPPNPVPGPFVTDSAAEEKRAVFTMTDYTQFTNQIQNVTLGYSSEAPGGGAGFCSDQLDVAKACSDVDPLHPMPYNYMPQAFLVRIHGPKWTKVDSLFWWRVDSISTARSTDYHNVTGEVLAYGDSLYNANVIVPYHTAHPTDTSAREDALYDCYWLQRCPTRAEMYYDLWSGVQHGMKSYVLNYGGDDQEEQIGLLHDTDIIVSGVVKHAIQKTQERKGLTFTDAYVSPYTGTNFSGDIRYRYIAVPAGFKQLFQTARTLITDELKPIVKTLKDLKWVGNVSWHKRDSTPVYFSKLPVKNVHTTSLTGSLDSNSATYVDFGIHKLTNDSTAVFVSLVNRRLWADPEDTLSTDYRKISFQVDSTKFNHAYSQISYWKISDVAGKLRDTTISCRDTFSFTVKPGQGKLLRIAPAIGLTTGEMSTNIFNNSRHIAPIEYNKDSIIGYVATYQKGGNIYVSYPTETPNGASKRINGTPADTLVATDGTYALQTPAIAYDSSSKTIGLVYCGIKPGAFSDDTARIFFKSAAYNLDKYHFSPATSLVKQFQVPKGYTPAPSIMPTNRSDGKLFWVGWTDTTHGGIIAILNSGGTIVDTQFFHIDHPRYAAFVSLASHKKFPNDVHIAYQECDQGLPDIGWLSHIFYLSATFNGTNITRIQPLNISAPFGNCMNYHPQISLTALGVIDVTWELQKGSFGRGNRTQELLTHSVVFRTRDIKTNWGQTLTSFTFDKNVPTFLGTDPIVLYPNIVHSDFAAPVLSSWSSEYRLMWNDPKTNSAAMAVFGRIDTVGIVITHKGWEQYTMAEPSAEPSLPHLSIGDKVVQPVLYRSPFAKDDGYYDARITQYDFPKTIMVKAAITQKTMALPQPPPPGGNYRTVGCRSVFGGSISTPYIHYDTTIIHVPFVQSANSGIDSTVFDSVGWNDNAHVRTDPFVIDPGDTIEYSRYFRTGFNPGDTATAGYNLTGSSDYLKMKLVLRTFGSNALRVVLDTAILKESGFTQTADTSNGGITSYIVPGGMSDYVYMSLEASRGDSTNGYSVMQTEIYGDTDVIDISPDCDSVVSYKKAAPSPTSQQPSSVASSIGVKVIPNPFRTSAEISVDAPKDVLLNVTLFDELGRKVSELTNGMAMQTHSEFTITSQTLSTGFYYLRVQSGSEVVTQKIQLLK